MKLEDYRLANCELFRVPLLDLSVVEKTVEQLLLESWKKGGNAGTTINSILENEEVVGQLADQIAKNLEYQRAKELQNVSNDHTKKLSQYDKDHAQAIQDIEATVGAEEKARREQLAQLDGTLQQKRQTYTAAQSDLEERRAKIREKLKAMGGREKFERLIQINETLQDKPANQTTTPSAPNLEPQTTNYNPQTTEPVIPTPQASNLEPQTTYQSPTPDLKLQTPKPSPTLVYTPNPAASTIQPVKKSDKQDSDLEKALDLALGEGTVDPLQGKTVEYLKKKEEQFADKPGFFKRVWRKTWGILNYEIKIW